MKTVDVDAELKTIRGEQMMFDASNRATFALVVESAVSSDDKIEGAKNRMIAKRIAYKCVSGGSQTFSDEEIRIIIDSVSRLYRPAVFFSVCDVLGVEEV